METIEATRHEPKSLFDAEFWLECEREAALMLRAITGIDDEQGAAGPDGQPVNE